MSHKTHLQNCHSITRKIALLTFALVIVGSITVFYGNRSAHAEQEIEKLNRFVGAQNSSGAAMSLFREGRDLIEEENWTRAAERFNDFLTDYPKDKNIDAALYWLAFALKKQERYADANQRLERLIREYPQSSWTNDARAMRIEIAPRLGNERLVNEGFNKNDEEIKLIALQSLFEANPEHAVVYVTDILKTDSRASQRLKRTALMLLGQHGGRQATTLLMDAARHQSDSKLRRMAITALGQTNDESTLGLLKELAANSEDGEIVKAAIFAISQQESARARGLLGELARTSRSPRARREAIFWLGQRGGESSIDELIGIYNADQDTENRKQILFALSQIGSPRASAKLLEIARAGDNLEVRKQAVFWLGQGGDAQALDSLITLYDAEKSAELKERIIFAFSQSGQKRALRKLMDIARNDASVELRKKAIFWLGQSRDPEATKFIEGLLK